MNGSFRHACFHLGSVALVMLATGCAQEQRPAQAPGRSETFESRAPEAAQGEYGQGYQQRPGAQPGAQQPGMQHPMGHMEHMQQQQQQQTGVGLPAEAMTEQQLCEQLAQDSTISVQDIDNGVRIILRPKTGRDLAAIREAAQRIEQRMQPMATAAPRGDVASQCALFDVGQLGARASIQERPDEVHLILTTTDTTNVSSLRQRAREFADQSGRTQQGQQQQR